MAAHEEAGYREQTVAERSNFRPKEEFGSGNVMAAGVRPVGLHLLCGIVVLFAGRSLQLINWAG